MALNHNGKKLVNCPYCHSTNITFLSDVDNDKKYCLTEYDGKTNKVNSEVVLPVNVYGCKDCTYVFMNIETLTISKD